jgi:hypothetical protein
LSAGGGCYRRTDGFRLHFSPLLYRPDGHKKTVFYRQGFPLQLAGSSHYKDSGFLPVHPSSGFCFRLCHRHSKQKRRSAALPEAVPGHHRIITSSHHHITTLSHHHITTSIFTPLHGE